MNINDYLIDRREKNCVTLLRDWMPPLPPSFTLWLVDRFGDVFVVICLLSGSLLPGAAAGQTVEHSVLVGAWELTGPRWSGPLQITEKQISWGAPDCRNLRYTVLRHQPQGEEGDVYVIDVNAPANRCRSLHDEKVLFHLLVKQYDAGYAMRIHRCPTLEDLDLFMQGRNRYCSGAYVADRQVKR